MNAFMANEPGLFEAAMNKLLTAEHEVTAVFDPAPGFRLLTLAAPELRGRKWVPGYMVQFTFGGWQHRAYTPLSLDADKGEFTFLAVLHGQGVAAQWFATLKGGERCRIGPTRAGTDLTTLQRPLVFFGDETSLSTAAALHATDRGLRDVKLIFEADDVAATRTTLEALKLEATVLQRNEFATIDRTVLQHCRGAKDLMLTGKSPSIQRIYRAAKGLGLRKVKNVAYWSPGKKGLSGVQK